MDYFKLTDDEIINVLQHYQLIDNKNKPINWITLISTIKVSPGENVSVELADLYIATRLLQQDCNELRTQWEDKIRTVKVDNGLYDKYGNPYKQPITINRATVTYEGDIKPPDFAFVCYRSRWSVPDFGYNVDKVGNKLYSVNIWTD